ncbi:putative mitochondrial protein, partial [Mucuna pruriens]
MGSFKVLGLDELHPIFFQANWPMVGSYVRDTICSCYYKHDRIQEIDSTLLVLIPKCDAPTSLHKFRPINLCKVIYKIITKIIATRHATNNVVIAKEIYHSMHKKKGKNGFMTIKVDLEKEIRFTDHFCKLILSCVSSIRVQVLFNEVSINEFSPSRGVRQGDPISPYLFVFYMERLTYLIEREVSYNNRKPIKLCRTELSISHLFFVDDLLLFGKTSSVK